MIKKRGWILLLIIVPILLSFYFDDYIVKFFYSIRFVFLDRVLAGVTFVSSGIIIFFILTSLFLWRENKRRWILPLWFTLLISTIVSFFIKILFQRMRPFQLDIIPSSVIFEKGVFWWWNSSFPSFQAMMVFSAIPLLSKEFPKLKYFWISFASIIALSRVYFGVHFLSDVLMGGVIGYLIGFVILKQEEENHYWEKIYRRVKKK